MSGPEIRIIEDHAELDAGIAAAVVARDDGAHGLPPANVMAVDRDKKLVTVCAWCPERHGDPLMGLRAEAWAAARDCDLTHGCCEACVQLIYN